MGHGSPKWSVGYGSFCIEKLYKAREQLVPIDIDDYQVIPGNQRDLCGRSFGWFAGRAVSTNKGRVCLCGDNCFLYKTIEENIPIGLTNNLYESIAFLQKLPSLGDIFLPGHDPRVYEQYPDGFIA